MRLNDIQIYSAVSHHSPMHEIESIAHDLGDIAEIIDQARAFVLETAMPDRQMDVMLSLMRAGLALLRDMGDRLADVQEQARRWQVVDGKASETPHSARQHARAA